MAGFEKSYVLHHNKPQTKATIIRRVLSPRLFRIDATLLCEFESDKA